MIAVDTHPIKKGNINFLSYKAYVMSHTVSSSMIMMMYTCMSCILRFGDYGILRILIVHVSVSCDDENDDTYSSCNLCLAKHSLRYPFLDSCHRFMKVRSSIPILAKYFEVFCSRSFRERMPAL